MPTINANDYAFDYIESGAGDPVVLVHGSVSDRRVWDEQRAALADRFRVIAYSRRYHWPNEPIADGADYAMLEHVDDLRAMIEALDAAPAHVVGHSYGGFLCLLLAIRAPELVRSLVLSEPPVLPLFASDPPKPHELLKLVLTRPSTALAVIKFGATGIGPATAAFKRGGNEAGIRLFGQAVLGRETFDAMPEERMEQVRANHITAEFLGSGFAPISDNEVRAVQAPMLLMTGERSPAIFGHFANRLQELLPHTHRTQIPGASHNINEASPSEYNAAVLSFLDAS